MKRYKKNSEPMIDVSKLGIYIDEVFFNSCQKICDYIQNYDTQNLLIGATPYDNNIDRRTTNQYVFLDKYHCPHGVDKCKIHKITNRSILTDMTDSTNMLFLSYIFENTFEKIIIDDGFNIPELDKNFFNSIEKMLKKKGQFIIPSEFGQLEIKNNWKPENMKEYNILLQDNNILKNVWLNYLPVPQIWYNNDKKRKQIEDLRIQHNKKILSNYFRSVEYITSWQPYQIKNFLFKTEKISYFSCKL